MTVEKKNGEIHATPPFTEADVAQLRVGDHVRFFGTIYTARDAAHRRMITALAEGKPLPFDIKGQVIYYVGPSPRGPAASSAPPAPPPPCDSTPSRPPCSSRA